MLTFRVILQPEPEGGYTIYVPSLSGCISWGKDIREARVMAKEAINLFLDELQESGEPIPDDSQTLAFIFTIN